MKSLLYNPCPFCGSKSIQPIPRNEGFEITCTKCGASVYDESDDLIQAATKWNTRVKNIETQDAQEVCAKCCEDNSLIEITHLDANTKYIREVFQWLLKSDYIIGKRKLESSTFLIGRKGNDLKEAGLIYLPYIIGSHSEESLKKYKEFIDGYSKKHEVCPDCGSKGHSSTLVGYAVDTNKPDNYKDRNKCVCSNCGLNHIAHDRISEEEFKEKTK